MQNCYLFLCARRALRFELAEVKHHGWEIRQRCQNKPIFFYFICICYLDIIIKMLHTTNSMSLFLHDLLFRFVFSAHFPAVFQKFSKGALPPRTPVGGLRAPPSPLLTKISRAAHAQILASLGIYPRSQSLLLKINLGSAHVFLSKRVYIHLQ